MLPYQHRLIVAVHRSEDDGAPWTFLAFEPPRPPADPALYVVSLGEELRYAEVLLAVVDDVGDVRRLGYAHSDKAQPDFLKRAWISRGTRLMLALESAIGHPLLPLQLKDWDDVYTI